MRHLLYFVALTFLFSCKSLAPNRMFITHDTFPMASDSINVTGSYTISPFDHLDLKIFSNDGFKLIDITGSTSSTIGTDNVEYVLNVNGDVKMPVIGMVNLKGLTVEQAERLLEGKYERYYNQPFVHLKVLNRFAIVFMGDGKGQVVQLTHENTTLYEVLAMAGGITDFAKAYRIKIIRGDSKSPQIFQADVSTLHTIDSGNLKIMSNDIIHVEAVPN